MNTYTVNISHENVQINAKSQGENVTEAFRTFVQNTYNAHLGCFIIVQDDELVAIPLGPILVKNMQAPSIVVPTLVPPDDIK